MGKYFGTDGVRGIANADLNCELTFNIGRAAAFVLAKKNMRKAKILVGKDTRVSGDMLESSLVAGICSVGATAIRVGVLPTPAVAYLVRKYNLDAGIMISASHNPVEYNGIKIFDNSGYKLPDSLEEEIEALLDEKCIGVPSPIGPGIGFKTTNKVGLNDYIEFLLQTCNYSLKGLKVAMDCANGSAFSAGPTVFEKLGAEVFVINNVPTGININEECGSTHMEELSKIVRENDFHIGIAYDGDADRCLAVDEKGELIDGDKILSICGCAMKKENDLNQNTIVATVMSNLGFFNMAKEQNIKVETANVGDRYVLECMVERGYNLGGEQSGHIIFLDHNTTGDGILTSLKLCGILKKSGRRASELSSIMETFPQVLINAKIDTAKIDEFESDSEITDAIKELEEKYSNKGRVLIRPSGTEPLIRVMIEGRNLNDITDDAKKLARLIEDKLG